MGQVLDLFGLKNWQMVQGQGNGLPNKLAISKDPSLKDWVVKELGKERLIEVTTENKNNVQKDDGGFTNLGSTTFNGSSGGILESFSCPRLISEGSVDVIAAKINSGLNPSRHTTVIFKETKDTKPGVSMNGVPF
ncbi:hypothetical protein J1N35_036540 [Gossypium stocksii]|uniref:Uncharacterized protein n=1 Tax=Gossypium stocksii TaxID=47602 RepID=A0A9D3UI44_9ROSI|nr:hypothetical protein J1N35_036540 [Gossypium stocksii]